MKGPRWAGVGVTMEAGKWMGEACKRIVVTFRHPEQCICGGLEHVANKIVFTMEPNDQIEICFFAKRVGFEDEVEERRFTFFLYEKTEKAQYVEEYAKLMFDAMRGDQTLFVSTREVDAGWSFIDPIVDAWEAGAIAARLLRARRRRDRQARRRGLGGEDAGAARWALRDSARWVPGWRSTSSTAAGRSWASTATPTWRAPMAADGLVPAETLRDLVAALRPPRVIWLMVPVRARPSTSCSSAPTAAGGLSTLLAPGDTVIDGGNTFFRDDVLRAERLAEIGVHFLDSGTSGGPAGAREGASLMIGGDPEVFSALEGMFADVAVPGGYKFFPGHGAGHFVKMVHNGIEYGMMQAIAEGFQIMHDGPVRPRPGGRRRRLPARQRGRIAARRMARRRVRGTGQRPGGRELRRRTHRRGRVDDPRRRGARRRGADHRRLAAVPRGLRGLPQLRRDRCSRRSATPSAGTGWVRAAGRGGSEECRTVRRDGSRLLRIGRDRLPPAAGGKAIGLRWLIRHGFRVPDAWVLLPSAAAPTGSELEAALESVIEPGTRYAIRSSADVEDGTARSFAGQFHSVLDVAGTEAAAEAVQEVLEAAAADSVRSYSPDGEAREQGSASMAVVVQEMVQPEFSGVAFSANPITGFTETIIEAVPGLGEGLMQRGETPERWIRKAGAWRSRPDAPELAENVAEQLAADVAQMARAYKRPVDVEWVLADDQLSYVQLRPITGIGEITYYSNRFSREMLPGIIVPLVWSVNIPVVNGVWIGVLDRLVGSTGLKPDDLAARFYCRAYFNMGTFGAIWDKLGLPRESLEMMRGMERSGGERSAMQDHLSYADEAAARAGVRGGAARPRAQGRDGCWPSTRPRSAGFSAAST